MTAKRDSSPLVGSSRIQVDDEHEALVAANSELITMSVQAMMEAVQEAITGERPSFSKHEVRVLAVVIARAVAIITQDLDDKGIDTIPKILPMFSDDATQYQR